MSFRHLIKLIAALGLSLAFNHIVLAHEYHIGALMIGHPYARATAPGQTAAGAYLSIENTGKTADSLLSIRSPIATSAELHTMSMDGNVMKMREVDSITVKPTEKIAMQPGGGYHIMLMGLSQALKNGDKFPLFLKFKNAGEIEVSVYVQALDKGSETEHQHH